MARSTITQAEQEFVETWQNIAPFQNSIITLGPRGDEVHQVVTGPGREFTLTTEERMITQEKVFDKKHDPFLNGSFRPVNVPDDITIESNPNALSDEEIFEIYKAGDFAWGEWMKLLDSPATLERMVDLANDAEGVTVKRLREVELRLREVKPRTRLTSKDDQLQQFLDEGAKPESRGQGGRSASYRSS